MIEDYRKFFEEGMDDFKNLPKLSLEQIDNLFPNLNDDNLFFKINFYGYYGYTELLDNFSTDKLFNSSILFNTAIKFNKLRLLKYLESRNVESFVKKDYNLILYYGQKIMLEHCKHKINFFTIDEFGNNCFGFKTNDFKSHTLVELIFIMLINKVIMYF